MISIKNVTKRYNEFVAVDNLSVDIDSFELFVIIGPSGSGKSTTMKMINRLIDTTDGEIYIDDKNINDFDPVELRRSMGYVIQDVGLMPHMTIAENISLVNRLKGEKRDDNRVDELLTMVGMDPVEFRERYPEELSGGQQQRIGVIRALYSNPNIILMDEPFSALDPVTKLQLQDEFLRIQTEVNKTIVFVTHDIDEALKIGDRILLMKDGKIEQLGTPRELLFKPKNEFVREFIGKDRPRRFAMQNFNVEKWMEKNYPTVDKNTLTNIDLIHVFKSHKVNVLPVIDNMQVVGTLSLYDVLNKDIEPKNNFITVDSKLDLDSIIKEVNENRNLLPIVKDKDMYAGVLDHTKLLSMLTAESVGGEA